MDQQVEKPLHFSTKPLQPQSHLPDKPAYQAFKYPESFKKYEMAIVIWTFGPARIPKIL